MGYEMCYFTRPYQFIRDTLRKHKNVNTINLNFLRKNNIYYLSPPFLSHTTSKKKKKSEIRVKTVRKSQYLFVVFRPLKASLKTYNKKNKLI